MFQNKPDNMKGLLTEEVNVRIYMYIYVVLDIHEHKHPVLQQLFVISHVLVFYCF